MGDLISGLIAALFIAVAPKAVQDLRPLALAHPVRAIWSGFQVTSALAGSGFVPMLTIVGVFLLPGMLTITALAIVAGYALGAYVLGVGFWRAGGWAMPAGVPGKFGLACLGAAVAGAAWAVLAAGWAGWRQMGSASDIAAHGAMLRQDLPATLAAREGRAGACNALFRPQAD